MKLNIKPLFFTIICIFLYGNINAQDYYSKVYFKQGYSVLASSVTGTVDNSYVIAGNYNGSNLLFKMDSDANLQWNIEFGSNYDVTGQVIELRDSTYLFATDYFVEELDYSVLSCLNFDSNGDTLWSTTTSLGNYVDVFSVEQTQDNGFIIGAKLKYSSTPPYYSIAIVKLDESGTLIWAKSFEAGTHSNDVFSVKQILGNGYVVVGTINDRDPYTTKAFLMRLDNDGASLWSKTYQSLEMENSQGFEVLIENDGFLLSIISDWKTHVIKTDINGEVEWANYYNTWGEMDMYATSKKRIFKSSDTSYVVFVPDYLFEINKTGELMWSTYYFTYLTDVALSGDGGFLVVGNGPILGVDKIPFDPQIGLIKTDKFGQTDELCSGHENIYYDTATILSSPVSFSSESIGMQVNYQIEITTQAINVEDNSCVAFIGSTDEVQQHSKFEVFPNPSFGIIHIKSRVGNLASTYRLLNAIGVEILVDQVVGSNWTIDFSDRAEGIFYLQISTDSDTETHKLVLVK